ncbi:penicillin-binding protein [Streptomyces abyssalis]|uniref:Penicillin-binding protein n=1 Tax=Streptomyces abyssalis TaxID=933944 RepID=A0A1E7JJG1_9ACTN|nr:transglycosylase domain-containing protein [Streptomyces abyssalis]OEU87233.1 penicillin-binding protein [Streptomyces abyssalis]OEU87765.1 penicillin-binding protein [Streptomyces abyssalis]OEV29225.1 penicillin-binding protein [Streptomyces nanshensis]
MSDEPKATGKAGGGRTGLRRLIPTWRWVLGGSMIALVLGCGVLVAGYLLVSIPPANKAAAAQTNVYLYSDGSQIARDGEVNRENITLAQVPKSVQEAVLAAEDREFYQESAIDPKAMLRAGWNMVTGGGKQSGSTITQQYVKNYYLSQDQTLTRKAKEFFIALKLDNEVSKSDILEGYLNTSYFGRNAYGIQAAAQAYYGKDIDEISTSEGAYLAALVNSPNAYDTQAHPENRKRAVARWHYVLDGMVKKGWITRSERDGMKFPEPDRAKPSTGMSGQRGYLVEAVKNYLINNEIIDERRLAAGGFRITTTLDPKRQKAMREAVDDRLMSKLDKDRKVDKYVRAGGTSVDPKTGKIVAMYGGIDYTEQYVNNATRRDYQVGSTFKPFIFTSALANDSKTQDGRSITASTVYDGTNKREVVSDGNGTDYAPENEDDKSYGQIPVSQAMNKSVNSVFAQMGVDVGPKKVKRTAIDLGLPKETPNMPEDGSIALGVATASTTDMAEAYATLANHGKRGHYSLVEKATHGGEVIELPDRDVSEQVERSAADSTTAVLRKVVQGGTGTAAQSAGRPAAGKTGTAEEDKAAWFAGYTPELATVISVMGQNSETGVQKPLYGAAGVERVNGGGFPAEIWGDYTKAALEGEPVRDFDLKTDGDADIPGTAPPSDAPSAPPTEGDGTSEPPPTGPTTPPTDPGTPSIPPTGPPTDSPTLPTGGQVGGDTGGPGGGPGGESGGEVEGNNGWNGGNTTGQPASAARMREVREGDTGS